MPSFKKSIGKRHLVKTYTKDELRENLNIFRQELFTHDNDKDSHKQFKSYLRDIIFGIQPIENIELVYDSGLPYIQVTPSTPQLGQTLRETSSSYTLEVEFFYPHDLENPISFMTSRSDANNRVLLKHYPPNTDLYVRARWIVYGRYNSVWSEFFLIHTPNSYIQAPNVSLPEYIDLSNVGRFPKVSVSGFTVINGSDTHVFTYYKLVNLDTNEIVFEYKDYDNLNGIRILPHYLQENTNYQLEVRVGGNYYISLPTFVTFTTNNFDTYNTDIVINVSATSYIASKDMQWLIIFTTFNIYVYKLSNGDYVLDSSFSKTNSATSYTYPIMYDYYTKKVVIYPVTSTSIGALVYDGTSWKLGGEYSFDGLVTHLTYKDNTIGVCVSYKGVYLLTYSTAYDTFQVNGQYNFIAYMNSMQYSKYGYITIKSGIDWYIYKLATSNVLVFIDTEDIYKDRLIYLKNYMVGVAYNNRDLELYKQDKDTLNIKYINTITLPDDVTEFGIAPYHDINVFALNIYPNNLYVINIRDDSTYEINDTGKNTSIGLALYKGVVISKDSSNVYISF